MIFTILNIIGSIFSIVGGIITLKGYSNKKYISILFVILLILSVISSISFIKYKKVTDEQLDYENRKQKAKIEAQNILSSFPTYISTFEPGENEGIIKATYIFLEDNQTIWPLYYEDFRKEYQSFFINNTSEKSNEQLKNGAEGAIQLLKSIAK